jgi:3-deoxy-manno-octulosonate cytidylyltransferase (CMP-KDO synthetase)
LNSIIVIPARLGSTRLPEKMLLAATGKTLIQHTYESASRSKLASRVIVATDNQRIESVVRGFSGEVMMTARDHLSGTDRVAEVARKLIEVRPGSVDFVVNVQGDEPDIDPAAVDGVIETLTHQNEAAIVTLAAPIRDQHRLFDPAVVKVVFDHQNRALYFSRSLIPTPRDLSDMNLRRWLDSPAPSFYGHIGVYGYRIEYLLRISMLPVAKSEQIESLEQLRFLHAGWPVHINVVEHASSGIDTAEDYAMFVNRNVN